MQLTAVRGGEGRGAGHACATASIGPRLISSWSRTSSGAPAPYADSAAPMCCTCARTEGPRRRRVRRARARRAKRAPLARALGRLGRHSVKAISLHAALFVVVVVVEVGLTVKGEPAGTFLETWAPGMNPNRAHVTRHQGTATSSAANHFSIIAEHPRLFLFWTLMSGV